jgi:hypothetical protein
VRNPVFMFCAPRLILCGTEGVGSRFHVLSAQTSFQWYRGRRVSFSCFVLSSTFSAVRRASGLDFMFCSRGLIFGGTEGFGSRFHVLRARTHFRRSRGRRVPFSCFARPDSFSTVSRASGPVFVFCSPGLFFGGAECVESRFHVLRTRTLFQRFRRRPILFSCFSAPGHVFGSAEVVESCFLVLRSQTLFRRN